MELAGRNAYAPFTTRSQDRLGFSRRLWEPVIYRLPLGGSPTALIVSSSRERYAQYSPDGRQIAFQSGRSGDREEVWLADADGSNPTRLTRGPGGWQGSPCWSPDGHTIAFDSRRDDGQWDIWTIGVDGSGLRQVTREPSDENMPSFSRDGRWIYFGSDRTGRAEVWRASTASGTEEQVTHEGGSVPFESFDGRTLYYLGGGKRVAGPADCRWRGADHRPLRQCAELRCRSAGHLPRGLYRPGRTGSRARVLRYWAAATGQDRAIATFEAPLTAHLSASADGRSFLYDRSNAAMYDLMMIENFR